MRNFTLAIGAGAIAVLFGDVMGLTLACLVPTVLVAIMFTGASGVNANSLIDLVETVETTLLAGYFVTMHGGAAAAIAICLLPILLIFFIFDLGSTPYPRLPRR